jgi:subtilisin
VKSEMKLNGNVVDQQTSSVSGNQAGGTHELRHRGGAGTYDIVLTVTDANGKTVSETKQITL